jgi:integrase
MRLAAYQSALEARGRTGKHQREEIGRTRLTLKQGGLSDLLPEEITPPMVELALAACSPNARRNRFGALDRFLRWCLRGTGIVAATAGFASFEKPAAPPARTRVLAGAELAAIWQAADRAPSRTATDIVRFLIAVPCRRGEAAGMRWADIDLVNRVWHQPTSKNGDPHDFPLNERAMAILSRRTGAANSSDASGAPGDTEYVFPAARGGKGFDSWIHVRDALRGAIGTTDWRLHDFRRSFATVLGDSAIDETVIDLCLNHRASRSRAGVRGIYQRAERWAERVKALDAWNACLERWLGENVASLRHNRG